MTFLTPVQYPGQNKKREFICLVFFWIIFQTQSQLERLAKLRCFKLDFVAKKTNFVHSIKGRIKKIFLFRGIFSKMGGSTPHP